MNTFEIGSENTPNMGTAPSMNFGKPETHPLLQELYNRTTNGIEGLHPPPLSPKKRQDSPGTADSKNSKNHTLTASTERANITLPQSWLRRSSISGYLQTSTSFG